MEFAFTDEQNMIADTVRSFFQDNATSERTRRAMSEDGIDRELWSSFCQELGLSGIGIPEADGGAGLGLVEMAIIFEASGAQVAAIPALATLALSGQAIAAGGSPAQKEAWLPAILKGASICAFIEDTELRVDDENRLTGNARFVAHGAVANAFVVTDGTGAWLVKADTPGVVVSAQTTMDQTRPLAMVKFKDAIGEPLPDAGAAIARARRSGLVALAAEALGGAQEALDRTVAYGKERIQFGRPIGSFQAYKHRLADMMIEIEQARSAVYWAACAVDEDADDADLAVHAAKSFAADAYFMVAGNMIQLHGGIGFTWEHDAHLFFKRARSIQSMLGSGNEHRERVATIVLGDAA